VRSTDKGQLLPEMMIAITMPGTSAKSTAKASTAREIAHLRHRRVYADPTRKSSRDLRHRNPSRKKEGHVIGERRSIWLSWSKSGSTAVNTRPLQSVGNPPTITT